MGTRRRSHDPCSGAPLPDPGKPVREVRCGCGSLLARLVDGAVELKCRRCKQTWTVPLEEG
jgi:hypothetical protein